MKVPFITVMGYCWMHKIDEVVPSSVWLFSTLHGSEEEMELRFVGGNTVQRDRGNHFYKKNRRRT